MSLADSAQCSCLPDKAPQHLASVTVPATNSRETGKELALSWGTSPSFCHAEECALVQKGPAEHRREPAGKSCTCI